MHSRILHSHEQIVPPGSRCALEKLVINVNKPGMPMTKKPHGVLNAYASRLTKARLFAAISLKTGIPLDFSNAFPKCFANSQLSDV